MSSSVVSAWEEMPSSWPPPPPHRPLPDFVEHLPQRPYESFTGCCAIDVSPNGQLVAACGESNVELLHPSNGDRLRSFQATDTVLSVKFSPDGRSLAVGTLDRRATLYDIQTGRLLGQTPELADGCDEIHWLDADRIAIGSQRGELWVVDAPAMTTSLRILEPNEDCDQLGGLAATADGRVAFISLGARLGAFDTRTGKIIWRFDQALLHASRLAVSPRGDVLVAAGYEGVALFDARTGQPGARMPLAAARAVSWPQPTGSFGKKEAFELSWSPRPRFSPNGDLVALQDRLGNLVFLDMTTFALHSMPRDAGRAWIEDLAWFADGEHLVVGGSDNSLAIWRVRPMERVLHTSAVTVTAA